MEQQKRPHFLFAFQMVGGNATIYRGMKESIGSRTDVDSSWVPISMHARDLIARIPPISLNESLANSVMAGTRIHRLEKAGHRFDAAYYFQHTIVSFLFGLRRRVPYLVAMDDTPKWFARSGMAYESPYVVPAGSSSRLKHVLTRSIYANAFHLLPLSAVVRDSLVEDYGVSPDKVTVIPPGIDLGLWRGGDADASRRGPFKVLFVGGDFERKGGDLLVELAGTPAFRDAEFHFATNSFAGEHRPNIHVHRGLTANSRELIDLYRTADVFVLPTRADTHSISSLEAMAMGLPVVATRIGGISDIVLEGRTGHLIERNDIDSLADRLRRLKSDRPTRLDMGIAARKRVETSFNLERNSDTVLDLLARAAHARSTQRAGGAVRALIRA